MSDAPICPRCEAPIPADAAGGICPRCAFAAGLDGESRTRTAASPQRRREPIPPEQLSATLPGLDDFELIGSGGMGTVYKARQRGLGRWVAVKVIAVDEEDERGFAERFHREARTLARLDHPNIVRVFDFGHHEGLYYLVMELVEGVTLRQTIEAGTLEPKEALAIVPPICAALQYAHDRGVVHRDIKPENILIDHAGALKIADFGLAKLSGLPDEPRLTLTRQVMGTPHYMAPEQFEHPETVDHRADIFALGVVFYELLTGELPMGRFPPPSRRVAVDVRLDEVVLRTLEKEPELRYQQASELGTDLESLSASGLASSPAWSFARAQRGDFEYRSRRTFWGLPLVHIVSSRDSTGSRMRVARGIIAVGDAAIGVVAIGGLAVGGVALGGMGVGVISIAGLALGLLLAFGGGAIGGIAVGGWATGIAAVGGKANSWLEIAATSPSRIQLLAWVAVTSIITALVAGAIVWWDRITPLERDGAGTDRR